MFHPVAGFLTRDAIRRSHKRGRSSLTHCVETAKDIKLFLGPIVPSS